MDKVEKKKMKNIEKTLRYQQKKIKISRQKEPKIKGEE
jgi:hypothetical protein